MKIGIFGGSFNPPHNGHLKVALRLLKRDVLDKIIFVPAIKNVCHDKSLVSEKDRLQMVKLLIDGRPNLEVSDIELKKETQSYTYQTLDEFKNMYPNDEIILIIGSDNLLEIERWREYEYILKTYKIFVLVRNDDNINKFIKSNDIVKKYKSNIFIFKSPRLKKMSSTIIREKIHNKENINSLVPKNIIDFISENNLYL